MRRFVGCACLLAALLLYAPLGMLAWWTGTRACCKSNYCPIAEHHKSSPAPTNTEHHGVECEHSAPGVAACTMSCCHDKESALMAPFAFVLDSATIPPTTILVSRLQDAPPSEDISLRIKPLSPPPRFGFAA